MSRKLPIKGIFLVVAVALLIALPRTWSGLAAHDDPPSWVCFPTCSPTDGRALAVAGQLAQTLTGNAVKLEISAAPTATTLPISVFDGDALPVSAPSNGKWDGSGAPEISFELFADPNGDGSGSGGSIGVWAGASMIDNDWYELLVSGQAVVPSAAAQFTPGVSPYRYVLVVTSLNPAALSSNSFKVRTRGTLTIRPNQEFAFVDQRTATVATTVDTYSIPPGSGTLLSTRYDGTWNFSFAVPAGVNTVTVYDGDMDYGDSDCAATDTDDADSPTYPTFVAAANQNGNPVLAEGRALTPMTFTFTCPKPGFTTVPGAANNAGTRSASNTNYQPADSDPNHYSSGSPLDDFLSNPVLMRSPRSAFAAIWNGSATPDGAAIIKNIVYTLTDPLGNTYLNANPSGNLEWEQFRVSTASFNRATMDYHANSLPAGIYTAHLEGVDYSNLNAWRLEYATLGRDEHENPSPDDAFYDVIKYVFLDQNTDGVKQANEPGIPGVSVTLVDPTYGNRTVQTDSDGQFSFRVPEGFWTVYVEPSNHATSLAGLYNTTPESSNLMHTDKDHPIVRVDFGYYYPPTATPKTVTTNCGAPVSIDAIAGTTYPNLSALTISSAGPAAHGTVQLAANHLSITYTPDPNCTTDTFPYTITGPGGSSSSSTITVNVNPNRAPVAVNDAAGALTNGAIDINVLANDSDPDGTALNVTSVTTPAHGTVTINPDQTIHYTPAANYFGPDSFSYTLTDACGATVAAVVTITVTPPPPPVPNLDTVASVCATATTFYPLANDTYAFPAALHVTAVSTPAHGTAVLNGDGTITYTPAPNCVTDAFTYTVGDDLGRSVVGNVSVSVTNQAPVAVADNAGTIAYNGTATVNVLANDSDPEGKALHVASVGTAAHGTVVLNGDGTITYTPNAGYYGADTFSYTLEDLCGASATAVVSVMITPPPPPVANLDAKTTVCATATTFDPLANDTYVIPGALHVTAVSTPSHGTAVLNANGTITYTPAPNCTNDAFTYTLTDDASRTVTGNVTVEVTNQAPIAVADNAGTIAYNGTATVNVLANDSDPEGKALHVASVGTAAHGTVVLNGDGTITYTPNAGYYGADTFSYTLEDLCGASATAVVSVMITPPPPPVANLDAKTTVCATATTFDPLANDTYAIPGALHVTAVSTPSHGTAVLNANGTITYTPAPNCTTDAFTYTITDDASRTATGNVTVEVTNLAPIAVPDNAGTIAYNTSATVAVLTNDSDPEGKPLHVASVGTAAHGTVVLNANGTITYTPNAGYYGADSFSYTLEDLCGASATAVVSVTITPPAPPVANLDAKATVCATATTFDPLANDTYAIPGALHVTAVSAPSHGTAVLNANGTITYTPAPNCTTDAFTYTVTDDAARTVTGNVTVEVTNLAPIAVADNAGTIAYNTSATVNVLANDSDPEGKALHVASVGTAAHGTVVLNEDGTITYTPNAGYYGSDSFSYTLEDLCGASATAVVSVMITPPAPPVANLDAKATVCATATTFDPLANDTYAIPGALHVTAVSTPSHGTAVLNANGTITYTPAPNCTTDAFTYTVTDDAARTVTGNVTVEVTNLAPIAVPDNAGTIAYNTSATVAVLTNDSDPEGKPLHVASVGTAAHGTVVLNANGTITYTPNAGYYGSDSFSYTLEDLCGASATAVVSVMITPPAPPVANLDAKATVCATSTTFDPLANDTYAIPGALHVTAVSAPSHGTAVLNANGTITYTPAPNCTTDAFTYTITDDVARTATGNVTVEVTNLAPIAVADNAGTIPYNTSTTVAVLTNDSDPEGKALHVASVGTAAHGTVVLNANGTITYTPYTGYFGADSFSYTLEDLCGASATAVVSVMITPPAPPVANLDAKATVCATATTFDPLANDTYAIPGALHVTAVSAPSHGTAVLNANGTITYTPAPNCTTDAFTYTVTDDAARTVTGNVTVEVTNLAPVAVADNAGTIAYNGTATVNVLANDSDPEGKALHVASVGTAAHGTVVLNEDGTITYTPTAGYYGADSFSYTLEDLCGASATAVVSVMITPPAPPVANLDAKATVCATATTFDPLANDTYAIPGALHVTAVSAPSHGTAVLNPNGTITYTPAPNCTTDAFTYTVTDDVARTVIGNVTVEVTNQAPIAVPDNAGTIAYNTSATVAVLANDSDPEGKALHVASVGTAAHGTVVLNASGTITYTPNAGYYGSDSFSYTLEDLCGASATAVVSVMITPPAPPVANLDAKATVCATATTFDPLANDTYAIPGALHVTAVSAPSHGTAVLNPNGTITYTPAPNCTTDAFTYTITDDASRTATGDVTVEVTNLAPVAVADNAGTIAYNGTATVNVLANDSDPEGKALHVASVGTAAHGTVVLNEDGTITYTPNAGYYGADSFSYTLEDFCGASATAVVSVMITPPAPPVANLDAKATVCATATTFDPLANDTYAIPGALHVTAVSTPSHGTAVLNANGTITYTPAPNCTTDAFTYTVTDDAARTVTGNVTVEVTNLAPVAVADNAGTIAYNGTATVNVLANDSDPEGKALHVASVGTAAHGTVVLNEDGTITYTPNAGYYGADSFGYTLEDFCGASATAVVSVIITPPAPPVANLDAKATVCATATTFDPLANDTYAIPGALHVTAVSAPSHGTAVLNANGTITYTPAPNCTTDAFTYTITDDAARTATGNVTVEVTNLAPIAVPDNAGTIAYNTSATVAVLTNDSDPEGKTLHVASVGTAAHGTVVLNEDGTITYTPNAGYYGADSFSYTLEDLCGASATAVVSVMITPPAPPVANLDAKATVCATATTFDPLANDTYAIPGALHVTAVSAPSHGTAVLNANGTITYTPAPNCTTDAFTYTVTDDAARTVTGNVTVEVTNLAPIAVPDNAGTIAYNGTATVNVLTNDSDPEGKALHVASVGTAAHGTVVLNEDGTITYTPNAGYYGADSFSYTLEDFCGASATAVVSVMITPPAPPVANLDAKATVCATATTFDPLANDTYAIPGALHVTAVSAPSHGTAVLNANGTITYTPAPNCTTDAFTYTITDDAARTATGNVTVEVTNLAPIAVPDNAGTIAYNTSATVAVLTNDSDPEGKALHVASVGTAAHGTVVLNEDGTITYTPNAGYYGADSFSYTLEDLCGASATAVVSVMITPPAPPTIPNIAKATVCATETTFNPLAGATYAIPGALHVTAVSTPGHGTAVLNANGTITYTPAPNCTTDAFTFTVVDDAARTFTANVDVTVTNTPPVAVADNAGTIAYNGTAKVNVLANDSDPEGKPLHVASVGTAAHGTVVLNEDGTITYTPNAGYYGADSFSYTLEDLCGASATAVVSVMITPPAPPTIPNIAKATVCATETTFNPLAGATYAIPGALHVTAVSTPGHGTAVLNANGTITYTPAPNCTTDAFTFTVVDDAARTFTANVDVTVTNTPPVAVADNAGTIAYNSSATVAVLTNDSDPEGKALHVASVGTAAHGTVVLNEDGTITYTPNAGYYGADSFSYTLEDLCGASATAVVSVMITPPAPPVANLDAKATVCATATTFDPLANDTYAIAAALHVTAVSTPSHGTAVLNANGTITYTPAPNCATDAFTYTITDDASRTATGNVTVEVTNLAPVAVADNAGTIAYNGTATVNVLANDSDPEGKALHVASVGTAAHGTVVLNANGTISYTPNAGYYGADSFSYTLEDFCGASATAVASVMITPPPPPVANLDAKATVCATATTFDPLANDTYAIPGALHVTAVSTPSNGTAVLNANGTITYTPAPNCTTDAFTYTVTDNAQRTVTGNVTVAVSNAAPVGTDDVAAVSTPATFVDINVLANDMDPEGKALSIAAVTSGAHGTVTVLPNGQIRYTPAPGYSGSDSFTYTLRDACGGTAIVRVTLTVTACDPTGVFKTFTQGGWGAKPSGNNPGAFLTSKFAAVYPGGVAQIGSGSKLLKFTSASAITAFLPAGGTPSVLTAGATNPTSSSAGVFAGQVLSVQLAVDFSAAGATKRGLSELIVVSGKFGGYTVGQLLTLANGVLGGTAALPAGTTVSDLNGAMDAINQNFDNGTVDKGYLRSSGCAIPPPPPPAPECDLIAKNDRYETNKDHAITIGGILVNDLDGYDRGLVVAEVNGSAAKVGVAVVTAHGVLKVSADGTFTYTPSPGYYGTDTFSYKAKSSFNGAVSNSATVTITIAGHYENDGCDHDRYRNGHRDGDGCAHDRTTSRHYDGDGCDHDRNRNGHRDGDRCDHDREGGVHHYAGDNCSHERRSSGHRSGDGCAHEKTGSKHYDGDACDHDRNRNGHRDGDGCTHDRDTSHHNTGDRCDHDRRVNGHYNGDDCEHDAEENDHHSSDGCDHDRGRNGHYRGDRCEHDEHETPDDDGGASCTVPPPPPVATPDIASTVCNAPVTISVLANDTYQTQSGLVITSAGPSANGTVTVSEDRKTVTFKPTAGYCGSTVFPYSITDGAGSDASSTVTVTVTNQAPVGGADTVLAIAAGVPVDIPVLVNDTDPEGTALTVVSVTTPLHGTATILSGGVIRYTSAAGFSGTDTFDYKVRDACGGESTVRVSVTTPVRPVANPDAATTVCNAPVTISALTNDTPALGVTISAAGPSANGTVTVSSDRKTITFAPAAGFCGTTSFPYTIKDGAGVTASSAVTVTVTNQVPVGVSDTATATAAGVPVDINVLANDTDPEGTALSVTTVTTPAHGTATLLSGGVIRYTAASGYSGTDTFKYTLRDACGGEAIVTVTITVQAPPPPTGFTTFTQGGWGTKPAGNNPGALLASKWSTVFTSGYVQIGGTKYLKFTSASAIAAFLPAGGTAGVLSASATNPTSCSGGVFAGQVLSLQLSVSFSDKGVTKAGLGALKVKSGKLAGYTVAQVLAMANAVLGGSTSALPSGVSIADLNGVVDAINNNFDNGTANGGYLQ